jgi:hypothetical protein
LAAVIVNFAKAGTLTSYPALGIAPGTNCLVIKANAADDWEAAIVNQPQALAADPASRHYGTCRDGMTWGAVPSLAKGKLRVRVQKGVDLRGRAIAPPVARWDWDERHRLNYLGVKCDSITWCEIGALDFVPSAPVMNAAGQPVAKGYYDEQYLADTTGTRVTSVFGTIVPSSDATDTTGMAMVAGVVPKFHLSHLRINETGPGASTDYRYYTDRFAALPVSPTAPFVRADTADLKIRPIGTFPTGGTYGVYDGEVNTRPLGANSVAFRSHPSSVVKVPTVRWRWQSNDEGTWGYCRPYGCCETLGKR